MVTLLVILIGSFSITALATSKDPPSSCGFGITLDLDGDSDWRDQLKGDYVIPDKKLTPKRAKYFPKAHIKPSLEGVEPGDDDNWLSLGCDFCADAEKEAAKGKWAIWRTFNHTREDIDTVPTDGGAKLLATCKNCPAAGGSWPWSAKATWTAYGNATETVKGSTRCCQQACLDATVCDNIKVLQCITATCCNFGDNGCTYKGPSRYCAKGKVLDVMQTIV